MPPSNDLIDTNVNVSSQNNNNGNCDNNNHNIYAAAPPFHPMQMPQQQLQPLQMNTLQSNFINDTMIELKEREAKRQKICDWNEVQHKQQQQQQACDDDYYDYDFDDDYDDEHGHDEDLDPTPKDLAAEYGNADCCSSRDEFDIWNELECHPDAIQLVATSGGLITDWNEEFIKLTKPPTSLEKIPLTIFEIVDSKSLPSLYSMLALSLHNVRVVDVEEFSLNRPSDRNSGNSHSNVTTNATNSDCSQDASTHAEGGTSRTSSSSSTTSHLSITLPCILFRNSTTRYNITVVYMNDIPSMKRCFLGIITPRHGSDDNDDTSLDSSSSSKEIPNSSSSSPLPRLPCGRILRVEDELLCRMLLGSSTQ